MPNPIGGGDHPDPLIFFLSLVPPTQAYAANSFLSDCFMVANAHATLARFNVVNFGNEFGIGILIIGANLYGGVYKLMISIREKLEEMLRIFRGYFLDSH